MRMKEGSHLARFVSKDVDFCAFTEMGFYYVKYAIFLNASNIGTNCHRYQCAFVCRQRSKAPLRDYFVRLSRFTFAGNNRQVLKNYT